MKLPLAMARTSLASLAVIAAILTGCSEKPKQPEQATASAAELFAQGNRHAMQTNIHAAVKLYAEVADRYPNQDFDVIMAWKSAGDLLSDSGQQAEAKLFYDKIITRFDKPEALPIVQLIVRGCKIRLSGELLLSGNRQGLPDDR